VRLSYGARPARHYFQEMADDLVVHAWDLARAIGDDTPIDPDLVTSVLVRYEPRRAELAGSAYFAPAVQVAPDADPEVRMAALFGRDPQWKA
jgi:uncharacterized protein (TIGR03086 family)